MKYEMKKTEINMNFSENLEISVVALIKRN